MLHLHEPGTFTLLDTFTVLDAAACSAGLTTAKRMSQLIQLEHKPLYTH